MFYLQLICSYVFMPMAFMMGIPYDEAFTVAELLGTKLFLNEFLAYEKLAEMKTHRAEGVDEVIDGVRQWISVSGPFLFSRIFIYWVDCRCSC